MQRVELGDGIARFEPSHRVATTTIISSVTAAARWSRSRIPALEQALVRAASRLDYGMSAHEVVLHGPCDDCRPAA